MKQRLFQFLGIFLLYVLFPSPVAAQHQEHFSTRYTEENLEFQRQQERVYKVRPFRIGVKIGAPNLVGGNLEYVLPMLGRRVALNADYSRIKSEWFVSEDDSNEPEDNLNISYLDLGLNYYFFRPGKGLYAGVSYSTLKADATIHLDERTDYIDEKHSSFNVKLGAKLGGLFYFRPEVGYSFNSLPEIYEIRSEYHGGGTETEIQDWEVEGSPAELLFKGLIFNIGFGFAF